MKKKMKTTTTPYIQLVAMFVRRSEISHTLKRFSNTQHGHKLYIRSRGRLHFFLHSSSAPRISLLAALYHSGHRHAITARRSTDCHRHTHSHTLSHTHTLTRSHTHTRTLTHARADTFHSCAEHVSVSPRLPSSMCSL